MKSIKRKIREVVRTGQHWNLPQLIKEKVNPILRGWGNYFKTGAPDINSCRVFRLHHLPLRKSWLTRYASGH
ncbi:hypothetical protein LWP49_004204 [Escherichia coli]|nr:hypothetical protein [Escherichia coli]EIR2473413.1 hypothetical protein [Escherichia coli]